MGLFDFFGSGKKMKITDIFPMEDIEKITSVIGPKVAAGSYSQMAQLLGKGLMDYLKNPSKEISFSRLQGVVKILESFKGFEPSLQGIMEAAIERFNALSK